MVETALSELVELARDVGALANEIRDNISLAGEESRNAWIELDREVERFREEAARGPKGSVSAVRERGFALKRRLRALRAKIDPSG